MSSRRADEFLRLVVDGVVSLWNVSSSSSTWMGMVHVMLLEASDGQRVVPDHGGIQHEDLPFVLLHNIMNVLCIQNCPCLSCHPSACSYLSTIDRVPDHVRAGVKQA